MERIFRPTRAALLLVASAALIMALAGPAAAGVDENLAKIKLPPGFKISVFAEVPRARSMAVDPATGTVFVGSRGRTIYQARDRDGDGKADETGPIANRLRVPNGIAFKDGALYIAEQARVLKWTAPGRANGVLSVILPGLPDKGHHGWRYAGFGPDGRLYVSLGSPCNICPPDGIEGTIIRMDADGGNREVYASGIRNSVGFDFHPKTGEMFFTDNGGDGMGDEVPADELNHVTAKGQFFGFPYFAGGRSPSNEYGGESPPQTPVHPVIEFRAHTASLGIRFYLGRMFPADYRGDALVAQHGSWNRSTPIGYRIMRVRFDDAGKAIAKEIFAEGWLQGNQRWGRPVDIKELPDGSLLVSDDFAGVIYRITYAP